MITVFVERQSASYIALFKSLGFGITADYREADFVCLTGGEDVTPKLYGDQAHRTTYFSEWRDEDCKKIFDFCQVENIPMVGICRGGQFLNVMSGGRMYQHVSGHGGDHWLTDARTGEQVLVSSTHHQMMMPSEKATILGVADILSSREWYDGMIFQRDSSNTGIEVVYYEHTKCLCFQPHPEFQGYASMRLYFSNLLQEFVVNPILLQDVPF